MSQDTKLNGRDLSGEDVENNTILSKVKYSKSVQINSRNANSGV